MDMTAIKEREDKEREDRILNLIEKRPGISFQEVVDELNLPYYEVASHLMVLEIRGELIIDST